MVCVGTVVGVLLTPWVKDAVVEWETEGVRVGMALRVARSGNERLLVAVAVSDTLSVGRGSEGVFDVSLENVADAS